MKMKFNKLLEEVRANIKKLDSCPKHDFVPFEEDTKKFTNKYECKNCGGTVDNHAFRWYTKGLEHGKKEANDSKQYVKGLEE